MLKNMPLVLSAEKIIDKAFKKTNKVQITDRNKFYRKKKTILKKTDTFANTIITTLENYVKNFPSINNLSMFYQELINIKVDINKLKKSLGAVDWARKTCLNVYSKQKRSLVKSKNFDFLEKKQQEIYGRISSIVKQIDNELENLAYAQNILKKVPEIKDIPTIVIAGYPNVGKSSLLRCLSSAKPTIATYPFTTKDVYVGHLKKKHKHEILSFQVIDTPGLLDRPLSERNNIEKQAIAALEHLADIIVFVFDSSETCGYELDDQKNLLKIIKKMFQKSRFIIVENKSDIINNKSEYLKISCETDQGIDNLKKELFSFYDSIKK